MDKDNKLIEEMDSSSKKDVLKKLISVKNLAKIFFFLLFLNLIYLDILLIQGVGSKQTIVQRFESITNQVPEKVMTTPNPDICPQSCVSQIQQAISSAKPSATVSPTPISANNASSQTTVSSQTKEYYVPFGSGSGTSSDWQDVPGLQASIDSSSYGSIKSVVFEASLHIPNGNQTASVRLFNSTDGHPVWNSEVDFNGNVNSVLLVSPNVSLDSGNKLYKVQIKTQLQFQAVLDQSRLHITTQ
jgi:hypothetical protein